MLKARVNRKTVASREYLPGEFLVVHRPSQQTVQLRGTRALVWAHLMQGVAIPEIIDRIHDRSGADRTIAENDVEAFIEWLYRKGLLLVDGRSEVCPPARPKLDLPVDLPARVVRDRIPYSAIVELTRTCHLRCIHCYHPVHADDNRLTTDEWKRILNELAGAGTCILVFTGGELFLRADAIELLEEATELGFIVNVLTTGTVLKPGMIERLAPLHLASVSLSLYGSTALAHDVMTQRPGSFNLVIATTKALRDAGLRVSLSFMITQGNFADRFAVQELATQLGVPLQIDFKLFPRHNGDPSPTRLRLGEEQVLELIDEGLVDYPEGQGTCMGGTGKFCITPEGDVKVCQVFPYPSGSLLRDSFQAIWSGPDMTSLATQFHTALPTECATCGSKDVCYRCPAMSLLESGSATHRHPYYCALTKTAQTHCAAKREHSSCHR